MEIKATKDLINRMGKKDFTKGQIYSTIFNYVERITEHTRVLNDANEPHLLGNWAKHFKRVK
jgi:hypothetical protein